MRLIVLDLDDTLYLERDYASSGFRAVGRWVQQEFGRTGFADRCRALLDAGVRGTVFDQALQQVGLPADRLVIRRLVTLFRAHRPEIELLPDARRFLVQWQEAAWLALISDGPLVAQRRKVRTLDLERWLDRCILTDAWGKAYWKPCPRAYQEVQRYFRVDPRQCVYVADNPDKDFVACHQLGWMSVRIRRSRGLHFHRDATAWGKADYEISSLDQMGRILPRRVQAAAA
jgi:putative hydrolase of the HAD superfamily